MSVSLIALRCRTSDRTPAAAQAVTRVLRSNSPRRVPKVSRSFEWVQGWP